MLMGRRVTAHSFAFGSVVSIAPRSVLSVELAATQQH